MYGDLSKMEMMTKKLDNVSSSFCLAKWMHATIHLGVGKTHSCYLPPTHKITLDEIEIDPSALHNTGHKKEMRSMMKKGKRPKECQICWSIEDLPGEHLSDRHYRSIDSWTMPYYDKIVALDAKESIDPSYLEVSFGNTCQLKCSYCSPAASSSWLKEIQERGAYKLKSGAYQDLQYFEKEGELPLPEDHNPYLDAFWKWWPSLINELKHFRLTGGEPLLDKHTFRILDWLLDDPRPELNFSINSNLCLPEGKWDCFIDRVSSILEKGHLKEFTLHASLDSFGERAEYIRDGLDFELFDRHIHEYLSKIPQGTLAIMCTFNCLSVPSFDQFLLWFKDLRIKYERDGRNIFLDLPHLQFPRHQRAQILPPLYYDEIEKALDYMKVNDFRKAEIEKLKRIYAWMQEPISEKQQQIDREDFYLFFKEKDLRRGTHFLTIFPELAEFWNECKSYTR